MRYGIYVKKCSSHLKFYREKKDRSQVEQVPSCLISSSSLSLLGVGGGSGKAAAAFAVVPACSLSGASAWCRGKYPRGVLLESLVAPMSFCSKKACLPLPLELGSPGEAAEALQLWQRSSRCKLLSVWSVHQ